MKGYTSFFPGDYISAYRQHYVNRCKKSSTGGKSRLLGPLCADSELAAIFYGPDARSC